MNLLKPYYILWEYYKWGNRWAEKAKVPKYRTPVFGISAAFFWLTSTWYTTTFLSLGQFVLQWINLEKKYFSFKAQECRVPLIVREMWNSGLTFWWNISILSHSIASLNEAIYTIQLCKYSESQVLNINIGTNINFINKKATPAYIFKRIALINDTKFR